MLLAFNKVANLHNLGQDMKLKDFFGGHPLDLFPRVRADDPITSFEAADSVKDMTAKHWNVICECLKEHGPLGKDGIARLTGLDGNQVARRMNEMKVMNMVFLTGKTVKSNSNRNEREWTV
jgi:predicted transcriptional regulator